MRGPRGGLETWMFRLAMLCWPRALRAEVEAELEPVFRARRSRGGGALDLALETLDVGRAGLRTRWESGERTTVTTGARRPWSAAWSTVRHGARGLRRSPGWALTTGAVLCVGVAAATSVFAVADAVLLRTLPYPEADRLVRIGVEREGRAGLSTMSGPNFRDIESRAATLAAVSAFSPSTMGVASGASPSELVRGGWVSGGFFGTLGVPAGAGRTLSNGDDRPEAPLVVVLSTALARRLYGEDDPLGRTLRLDRRPATVVGVMPTTFHPPEGAGLGDTELWAPLTHAPLPVEERGLAFLDAVGRIADGESRTSAAAELLSLGEGLIEAHGLPARAFQGLAIQPLRDETVAGAASTLRLLLVAVGVLLGIAALNAGNLVLLRTLDRTGAIRVRRALGASWARVTAESAVESLFVAGLAGGTGIALAAGAVKAVVAWDPIDLPRLGEAVVDLRVAGPSLLLALVVGLVSGILPAAVAGRRAGAGPVRSRASRSGRATTWMRDGAVAVQVALGLALTGAAALVGSSLASLRSVPVGLAVEDLHVATLRIDGIGGPDFDPAVLDALLAAARARPEFLAVGLGSGSPYVPGGMVGYLSPEGVEVSDEERMRGRVEFHRVSGGALDLLGIPLVRGRDLSDADRSDTEPVVVVSEAAARAWWDGEDPLGRTVVLGGDGSFTRRRVVGIAADPRYRGPGSEAEQHVWIPWAQGPLEPLDLRVRVRPGAEAARAIAAAVQDVPGVTVRGVRSVRAGFDRHFVEPTFFSLLFGAFAGAALLFSGIGVYAVLSHSVRTRRAEFGVRMALGADRHRLVRGVLVRATAVIAVGAVLGALLSAGGAGLVTTMLFEVEAGDPTAWSVAILVLLGSAILATGLPAWRAGATDPVANLRQE